MVAMLNPVLNDGFTLKFVANMDGLRQALQSLGVEHFVHQTARAGHHDTWLWAVELKQGRHPLADDIGVGREPIVRSYIIWWKHTDGRPTVKVKAQLIGDSIGFCRSGYNQQGGLVNPLSNGPCCRTCGETRQA